MDWNEFCRRMEGKERWKEERGGNPALIMVGGVLTAFCSICQAYMGDVNGAKTKSEKMRFIRREYCPNCQPLADKYTAAERQKRYRKSKRLQDKLLKQAATTIALQEEKLMLQRERNRQLELEIEQLRKGK